MIRHRSWIFVLEEEEKGRGELEGIEGLEVGHEGGRIYTYRYYTVTTRMTPALRWAVMRANLMLIVKDTVTRQCLQTTTFLKRKESRSGSEPSLFCSVTSHTARPNLLTHHIMITLGARGGEGQHSVTVVGFPILSSCR